MTRILYRLRHGMAANRLIAWSEDERAAADYRRWAAAHARQYPVMAMPEVAL